MKCLRKVKTTNAQFQNGTFSGFLTFEMDSSPIHIYNNIQVPFFFLFLSFIHHQNMRKTSNCRLSQLENLYETTWKVEHFPYHIL